MSIPENHADAPTTLADRWADAEAKAVTSLIAPLSHVITARERRINLVADYLAAFKGQRQTGQKFCDIYGGIDRLARAGTLPLAGPLEADLRRVSAVEAANFIAEHKHDFPGDAENEFWISEAIRLGKLCGIRSRLADAGRSLDLGQSLEDISPILSDLQAEGESVSSAKLPELKIVSIGDIRENPEPEQEWVIDGLVPSGTVTNLAGHGGTGKSLLLLEAAAHVVVGMPFLGRNVARGAVVYFSGEDGSPMIRRRMGPI